MQEFELVNNFFSKLSKHNPSAIGLNDEDFKKPFVGIASTGYEGNPCNMHLNQLSKDTKIKHDEALHPIEILAKSYRL